MTRKEQAHQPHRPVAQAGLGEHQRHHSEERNPHHHRQDDRATCCEAPGAERSTAPPPIRARPSSAAPSPFPDGVSLSPSQLPSLFHSCRCRRPCQRVVHGHRRLPRQLRAGRPHPQQRPRRQSRRHILESERPKRLLVKRHPVTHARLADQPKRFAPSRIRARAGRRHPRRRTAGQQDLIGHGAAIGALTTSGTRCASCSTVTGSARPTSTRWRACRSDIPRSHATHSTGSACQSTTFSGCAGYPATSSTSRTGMSPSTSGETRGGCEAP